MTVATVLDRLFSRLFGPARVSVAVVPFVVSLVLTPVLFGLSGVLFVGYGVLVTAVAAVLGLPVYATCGALALYVLVTRHVDAEGRPTLGAGAVCGLIANLASGPVAVVVLLVGGEPLATAWGLAVNYTLLGLLAAPMQTLIFTLLYRSIAGARSVATDAEIFT